jgi:TM2 domain-containing membrane protein YozV
MRGKIFSFDVASDMGVIASEDADRYELPLGAWNSVDAPLKGTPVEFSLGRDGSVEEVYKMARVAPAALVESEVKAAPNTGGAAEAPAAAPRIVYPRTGSGKSRFVAAALAFFFGGLGVHKFYIGDRITGIIMLAIFLFGLLFMAIPSAVVALVAIIECVIYLFTSELLPNHRTDRAVI